MTRLTPLSRRAGRRARIVADAVIVVLALTSSFACRTGQSTTAATTPEPSGDAAPIYGIRIPPGYRDWTLISMARVGAPLHDIRAKLGNRAAITAYREGRIPFADGTIIARLAYREITSEENNNVFA